MRWFILAISIFLLDKSGRMTEVASTARSEKTPMIGDGVVGFAHCLMSF